MSPDPTACATPPACTGIAPSKPRVSLAALSRQVKGWPLTRSLLRWSWPCEVCGSWGGQGLCGACHAQFVATQPVVCPRCALPCPAGQVCGACLRRPPNYRQCVAAVAYGFPFDRLVARLKFKSQPELAGLLGGLMHRAIVQRGETAVSCVLPMPLSTARLAERGYNQAWELARCVASRARLPAEAHWLLRLRDTPHQVGLSRAARERNLHDAMWVDTAVARLAGRDVALVDDVLTTGGTARAATQALLDAGAASVQVWVLARTPAPGS